MKTGLKTWEDIKDFDDIIMQEEKEIISRLEKESNFVCPHLKKEGNYFYYCGLNMPDEVDKKPSPTNQIYSRHVDLAGLQLFCRCENFNKCSYFSGELKR
jgi:hypothetical protein